MSPKTKNAVKTMSAVVAKLTLGIWAVFAIAVHVRAAEDEVDARINEINQQLLESEIEAVEKSLASVRDLAADLVKRGDHRKEIALAREAALEHRLRMLQQQNEQPASTADLRKLEKEFEAVDDVGGWWWLQEGKDAQQDTPWYRLDKTKKRFVHWFKDRVTGKAKEFEDHSWTYEILGLDGKDNDIIEIRMVGPAKPGQPPAQETFRFNRKTRVIQSPYDFYGKPKK